MRRFLAALELEWKILFIAAFFFLGFLWPVQNHYMLHMQTLLEQSIDHGLEGILRIVLAKSPALDIDKQAVLASLTRNSQWRAMLPLIMDEQRRSFIWFSAILFLIFLCIALYILSRLTKPLKRLSEAADLIGKGKNTRIVVSSGGALRRLEASMTKMQEELSCFRERALSEGMEMAWRDIAAIMAHEIKNPLTPIRLTLDVMQEKIEAGETPDNTDMKKYTERISLQIEHLEDLVNKFRSFSKEPEVFKQITEVRPLFQDIASGMKSCISTVIYGTGALNLDIRLFKQVLLNLWKNASEAKAKNITVKIEREKSILLLKISDDGEGILPERIERIWVPYVSYKKGGAGIGLPVVKRLVEAMNGTVSLSSPCRDSCRGTEIVLCFPAIENNQPSSPAT